MSLLPLLLCLLIAAQGGSAARQACTLARSPPAPPADELQASAKAPPAPFALLVCEVNPATLALPGVTLELRVPPAPEEGGLRTKVSVTMAAVRRRIVPSSARPPVPSFSWLYVCFACVNSSSAGL